MLKQAQAPAPKPPEQVRVDWDKLKRLKWRWLDDTARIPLEELEAEMPELAEALKRSGRLEFRYTVLELLKDGTVVRRHKR